MGWWKPTWAVASSNKELRAPVEGDRAGYRVLLAFRNDDRTVFVYGFAKNERNNIDDRELEILRDAASSWLAADATMIGLALAEGLLIEVEE